MKNRKKQRANRKRKKRFTYTKVNYYNSENYCDPTAYAAIKNIERKHKKKKSEV